jgi:hypothetical protein
MAPRVERLILLPEGWEAAPAAAAKPLPPVALPPAMPACDDIEADQLEREFLEGL